MATRAPNPMAILESICPPDEPTESSRERAERLAILRQISPEQSQELDALLIREIDRRSRGLREAAEAQKELRALVDRMTVPPWHAATFIRHVCDPRGDLALVQDQGGQRVVSPSAEHPPNLASLRGGERVFLNADRNLLVAIAGGDCPPGGEIATYESTTADGRLHVTFRGENLLVEPVAALRGAVLRPGLWIRLNADSRIAFEAVEPPIESRHIIGEVPNVPRCMVGGQDEILGELIFALTARLIDPGLAASFGLGGRLSIMLKGPPGCGKTHMVRAAVTEVIRVGGRDVHLAIVKPGEWENCFVGRTQENIRSTFASLNRLAEKGLVVLYLDEVESIGRTRGASLQTHSDKFLAALLAELDGFCTRSGVCVLSSTNRADLIDEALGSRLNDIEIVVGRPNRDGARAIFAVHLPDTLPFSPNGSEAHATREEVIDRAVSQLYAPNADNAIATIRFRDGKARTVTARDLVSGRLIEQTCHAVKRRAFRRAQRREGSGIATEDVDGAVADAIRKMRSTLTLHNVEHYIADLPQDIGVVAVEPVIRRVTRRGDFVSRRTAEGMRQ